MRNGRCSISTSLSGQDPVQNNALIISFKIVVITAAQTTTFHAILLALIALDFIMFFIDGPKVGPPLIVQFSYSGNKKVYKLNFP